MRNISRWTGAVASSALALSGLALSAGPASASHLGAAPCLVVTANTHLTHDIGPCAGHGIVITASNITLDMSGFTVTGAKREMEQAGILLDNVTGVTVKNGGATRFDSGVAIEGGGHNTITGLNVHGNVNDMIEAIDPRSIIIDPATGPTPEQRDQIGRVTCDHGDGITVVDSSDNLIKNNFVVANGPYSGISLVGDSNGNKVADNQLTENDLLNDGVVDGVGNPVFVQGGPAGTPNRGFHVPAGTPGAVQPQSMCGATEIGTPGMSRGREVQSIGVRVEGPGADRNVIDSNGVSKSGLAGISFHSYVFTAPAPSRPPEDSNRTNMVTRNSVSRTGFDTHGVDTFADGIASLASGPVGTTTRPSDTNAIVNNDSFNNFRNGISLGRLSYSNNVSNNQVTNNGGSGIWVAGPATGNGDNRGAHDNFLLRNRGSGNGVFDGTDLNPNCDNNNWMGNHFITVSQPCVGGSTPGARGARTAGGSSNVALLGGISHSRLSNK